jgi:branched-chain amino acid transport system ATP-binding protein
LGRLGATHHEAWCERARATRLRRPLAYRDNERRTDMLAVKDLHAYYGKSHILHGVHLSVGKGEIVSLLGRNGVGRSTTIKAIMGQVVSNGSVKFKDRELMGTKTHLIARAGLGYVPENRDIFPTLTVRQNLMLGMKGRKESGRWSMDDMYQLFPRLRERADAPAGVLSGGEQQMLTLCRTLMGDPDLVMIDEPTEGLAPKIVEQVANLFDEIAKRGISILLVEQKLTIALKISQRLYVMGHGEIVFEGTPEDLRANEAVRKEWLEV